MKTIDYCISRWDANNYILVEVDFPEGDIVSIKIVGDINICSAHLGFQLADALLAKGKSNDESIKSMCCYYKEHLGEEFAELLKISVIKAIAMKAFL